MKKITVKKLALINFKGAKSQEIDFSDLTIISGDNATGKSTIADAWHWLWTGKNQDNMSDTSFDIKHKENEISAPKIVVSVEAMIDVDGVLYTLKRELKEKWQKPRNSEHEEFVGNETIFYIDNVPTKTKRDWEEFLNTLIEGKTFSLISNPMAFNKLDWKEQRSILESMVTVPTSEEVLGLMPEALIAKEQLSLLKPNETVDSKRKAINQEISTIKKHIETFDAKVEEVNLAIAKLSETDYSVIEKQVSEKETEIKVLTKKLTSYAEAQESVFAQIEAETKIKNDLVSRKYKLESEQMTLINNAKTNARQKIQDARDSVSSLERTISNLQEENSQRQIEADVLRQKFADVSNGVYEAGVCGACNRPFEETAESKATFEDNKKARLLEINNRGKAKVAIIANNNNTIAQRQTEIEKHKQSLIDANRELQLAESTTANPEIAELEAKIIAQTEKIDNIKVEKNESDEIKLNELQAELKVLTLQLSGKTQIEANQKRLQELEAELKANNQKLTVLQGQEYALKQFDLKYYELTEHRVNSLFKLCQFSFYKELINGEIEQRCVCTENGVTFHSVNNGSKVNIGLEIINVLSQHIGTSFPIFVDNAESVTRYIPTVAQIVLLIVDEEIKKLQILNK